MQYLSMVLWRLLREILTVMAPVRALVTKLTGRTCGDRLNGDHRDALYTAQ